MKKISLILLFVSFMGSAQFFEPADSPAEEETQEYEFSKAAPGYDQPDQGVDDPGNPADPAPINDWLYLLPLIGIGIGVYFLRDKKKWA